MLEIKHLFYRDAPEIESTVPTSKPPVSVYSFFLQIYWFVPGKQLISAICDMSVSFSLLVGKCLLLYFAHDPSFW